MRTGRGGRWLALALLLATGAACSTGSPELRERGGVTPAPTLITMADGSTVRIDTQSERTGITEELAISPDTAFTKLAAVYDLLGIEIRMVLERERALGNPDFVVRRQLGGQRLSLFLECGAGPTGVALADSYELRLSIVSQVLATPSGGSTLTTRVSGTARPMMSSGNAVSCATRGELERRIAGTIRNATRPR